MSCCSYLVSVLVLLLACRIEAQAVAPPLRPYTACHLSNDLTVVQKEPTPAGASGRTAVTLIGPKQVPILRGERLLFAYPGQSPFARVLVEQLPAKGFPDGKANLVSAFDKLIASDNTVERNYMLKPEINGFEAHGLDRKAIIGSVLGVYLLIDDAKQMVISIDFLNLPETERSFASVGEFGKLRDAFLNGYSSCVRANLRANAAAPSAKTTTKQVVSATSSTRK